MSGRIKAGRVATGDNASLTINETILKECHRLYADPEDGLVTIADGLDLALLAPRKKINVLLIGNHSAGKSSFVNWYIEEHVQKTGVAIETQGFTFITSGKKRESLTGNATLHLYPHFEPLREIPNVVDYLSTEISTSKQKKFSLVTFVDTPGLVDGDMKYPFDVNKSILWLGNHVDLIFVFFDPIGQALCKRTLNLVERLNETHADKIRFYLAKADEAGHESDRQRVMMQIVQELCKRPGLNRTGFDMPTIFIPTAVSKPTRCANQIDEVCREIEKTINRTVQNLLNSLEKDCDECARLIDRKLELDRTSVAYNFRARTRNCCYSLLSLALPLAVLVSFLASTVSHAFVQTSFGPLAADYFRHYVQPTARFWAAVPAGYAYHVVGAIGCLTLLLFLLARCYARSRPTLSRSEKRRLNEQREYITHTLMKKKAKLYQDYLLQAAGEHDM